MGQQRKCIWSEEMIFIWIPQLYSAAWFKFPMQAFSLGVFSVCSVCLPKRSIQIYFKNSFQSPLKTTWLDLGWRLRQSLGGSGVELSVSYRSGPGSIPGYVLATMFSFLHRQKGLILGSGFYEWQWQYREKNSNNTSLVNSRTEDLKELL